MTARPQVGGVDVFPDWATSDIVDSTSGMNNAYQYPAAWSNYGWSRAEKPPRQYDNWNKRYAGLWLRYLDEQAVKRLVWFIAASDASTSSKGIASATCDGTDDQVQINSAIVALAAVGGGTVVLSEGTFYINGAVTLGENVSIIGQGVLASTLKVPNAVASSFNVLDGTAIAAGGIKIADLAVDGNKAAIGAFGHEGIVIGGGADCLIDNVACFNLALSGTGGIGIEIDAAQSIISRCKCNGNDTYGYYLNTSADNLKIVDCQASSNTLDAILDQGADDLMISNFRSISDGLGLTLVGDRQRVVGCNISLSSDYGISISGDGCSILGTLVRSCSHHGIILNATTDAQVVGCRIDSNGLGTDNTYSGIRVVLGSGHIITGNQVRRGAGNRHKYGIELADAPNAPTSCLVFGNDCVLGGSTSNVYPQTDAGNGAKTMPGFITSDGGTTWKQNNMAYANLV